MTSQSRTTLKTYFNAGDQPTEAQFADLIDSAVNVSEETALFPLLAGRAGGQTLYGGTAANDGIAIHGTSDAMRETGYVLLQPSGGNVGIGTTSPPSPLTVQGAASTAVLGSELVTTTEDRDFSGAGNWTGDNWSVGSGVATKATTSNSTFVHTLAAVIGKRYQVKATVTTTTVGAIRPVLGGQGYPWIGREVGTVTQHVWVIVATDTTSLRFETAENWEGSVDDVSVMEITPSSAVLSLLHSDGSNSFDVRSGGIGLYNFFAGLLAGVSNVSGSNNLGIGKDALSSNISGVQNLGIGSRVLARNTGSYNIAVGYSVLNENSVGTKNVGIGRAVFAYNTTGSFGTAIGHESMFRNTVGLYNTSVGAHSACENLTGSKNVSIGYAAGRYQANGSTALTTANTSIYIGSGARGYSNSDSNSLVIGYEAIGQGANTAVIGNSSTTLINLFGALKLPNGGIRPAADSTTALQLQTAAGASVLNVDTANGRVGIGITAPLSTLSIVGGWVSFDASLADAFNGGRFRTGDGANPTVGLRFGFVAGYEPYIQSVQSASNPGNLLLQPFNGLVGINTTVPAEALDVTGNINTTGVVKVDDVQVLSNRVIDARCADVANSGDATTDGLIDALRDALVAHGLLAAS